MPDSFMDSFVQQLVASGGKLPDLDADARYALARAQVKFAMGCLSGEPNRAIMAIVALEGALLHLREAEGRG